MLNHLFFLTLQSIVYFCSRFFSDLYQTLPISMDTKTLLILAAGIGSRYGGNKQREIVGEQKATIMDYSIYDALQCGFNKIVFLIRPDFAEDFQAEMQVKWGDKVALYYAYQETQNIPVVFLEQAIQRQKPWGTAHALICANNYLNEPFVVINADDYYGRKAFELAAAKLASGLDISESVGILYHLEQTLSEYGSVNRGICQVDKMGIVQQITETFNISKQGNVIYDELDNELDNDIPVSMNFWIFHPTLINLLAEDFAIFLEQNIEDLSAEFLLPTCLNKYIQNHSITVRANMVNSEWFGITYREDLPYLREYLAKLTSNNLYPKSIFGGKE